MAKKKTDEKLVETVAFDGLIDVLFSDLGFPVFYFLKDGELRWDTRYDSGQAENDESIVWVLPRKASLPWKLASLEGVETWLTTDTNEAYFRALVTHLEENIEVSDRDVLEVLAAWVAHTHIADRLHASPFIVLAGLPETGKTRTLQTTVRIARRGVITMVAREAALIRYAHDLKAAVGLDLEDFMSAIAPMKDFFLARPYNNGTVSTRILTLDKGPFDGVRHFEAYGPTIVATNVGLSDEIISSRSLVIQSQRGKRRFTSKPDESRAAELRDRGVAFRARVIQQYPEGELPAPPNLPMGRLGEIIGGLASAALLCHPPSAEVVVQFAFRNEEARRGEFRDTLQADVLRAAFDLLGGAPNNRVLLQRMTAEVNSLRKPQYPVPGKRVASVLRSFSVSVAPGAQNKTHVDLVRDQLAAVGVRYGMKPYGAISGSLEPVWRMPDGQRLVRATRLPDDHPDARDVDGAHEEEDALHLGQTVELEAETVKEVNEVRDLAEVPASDCGTHRVGLPGRSVAKRGRGDRRA